MPARDATSGSRTIKGELEMVKEIKVEKIFKCEICGSIFLTRKEAEECELACREEMAAYEDWERIGAGGLRGRIRRCRK